MTENVENPTPDRRQETRFVILASSLGTVFETYDFFLYGTLAAIIGRTFFPSDNAAVELIVSLFGFAVGFGFRPLGAALFGHFGDRFGRKRSFLATILLMGLATAAIGLVPAASTIGYAAPAIIILLRILQGLALGGEYGGAVVYVAEHVPDGRRGYFTSFVQAGVGGGFLLSLCVVLSTQAIVGQAAWEAWGWRIPFLLSLPLLAISLWMRTKLAESPVFEALKQNGEVARNPIKESFTSPGNPRRLLVALFGIAAGITVISFTTMFQLLYFLQVTARVEAFTAQLLVGVGAAAGIGWIIFFGWLSDKVGRRRLMLTGYALTLTLLLPLFQLIGASANPSMAQAQIQAPITVSGQNCDYRPFVAKQTSDCARILDQLTGMGLAYKIEPGLNLSVAVGDDRLTGAELTNLPLALTEYGYQLDPVVPGGISMGAVVVAIIILAALSGMTFGPAAAALAEIFPARIRYSSLSIPYHIGTGYFGGFLPVISQYIAVRTGDPYSGLLYTIAVVALALIVTLFGLREQRSSKTSPKSV